MLRNANVAVRRGLRSVETLEEAAAFSVDEEPVEEELESEDEVLLHAHRAKAAVNASATSAIKATWLVFSFFWNPSNCMVPPLLFCLL